MIQDIEKVRKILNKPFCFMEWQAKDARERGDEPMNKEDIEFLLTLDGIVEEEIFQNNEVCDSSQLFAFIKETKQKGFKGAIFWAEGSWISEEDEAKLKEIDCFIRLEGQGSVVWQEIYFSEEDFIRAEISYFKNFFGSFASVAGMI